MSICFLPVHSPTTHEPVPAARQLTLLRWYYAATPMFWVLDAGFGISIRVAFLDGLPLGQNLYYVLCCGIGIATAAAPRHANQLAFIESMANICLLILSVGMWYLRMLDWAAGSSVAVTVPTLGHLGNFVMAAAAAAVSYQRQQWRRARIDG